MNCGKYEADLVDLARGVDLGVAARQRVDEHLQRCPGCAARFASQQHLTAALRTVASVAPQSSRSAAIEQHLLRAFAERQASAAWQTPASRSVFATPAARRWLAAAAVLVLAAGVWLGSARWRPAPETQPVSTRAMTTPAALEPAMARARGAAETLVRTSPGDVRPLGAPPQARSPRDAVNRGVFSNNDQVLRFVALPTAAGLPGLESGRIVRVELPMAILPAYGLDVVPDAAARVVEADVLVGQDGQPRAIRFVTLDSAPRRRR